LNEQENFISDIKISALTDTGLASEQTALEVKFKIDGKIREVFVQKNWERAYNKHDNIFRVTINLEIRAKRTTIFSTKLVRKAAFFWTRNPKIQHRIWVQIVKDDMPFYPLSVDESKSLLFDFDKIIELDKGVLNTKSNKIGARITVSWGKHNFTEPIQISGESDNIELNRNSKVVFG
jgi:hypothetical protein